MVIYDYRRTRPRNFLAGFNGYLHVDGYAGYHKVKDVTLVGARRKYDEALKAAPEARGNPDTVAAQGLAYCIERELKEAPPEGRHKLRAERSRPYYAWLHQQKSRTMPKSLLGKAIAYSLNPWEKLSALLKDGILEIDNNRSERSIKPFGIGRKNGLVCEYSTRSGGQRSDVQRDRNSQRKRAASLPVSHVAISNSCRNLPTCKSLRHSLRSCHGHRTVFTKSSRMGTSS
ncbi:transposase and inactivated derivative [Paenibacillus popilliae ATCC 14706]|uniref:Transposase and inactivated derivative n=1 Tax=Paenibacillus popilliae ATCC 14706 TaxID=1212764 RepID=M9LGT9_PAEPP|nr:transposase and inactivated derivative [Paenibacillus popilliae ATCC 14706]